MAKAQILMGGKAVAFGLLARGMARPWGEPIQ